MSYSRGHKILGMVEKCKNEVGNLDDQGLSSEKSKRNQCDREKNQMKDFSVPNYSDLGSAAYLTRLVNCADLKPPSYLLPLETTLTDKDAVLSALSTDCQYKLFELKTSDLKNCIAAKDETTSKKCIALPGDSHILKRHSGTNLQCTCDIVLKELPNETNAAHVPLDMLDLPGSIAQTSNERENSSSPDSDPFGGDDEVLDPDFQLSDNKKTWQEEFKDSSDHSTSSSVSKENRRTRKRLRNQENWRRNKIKRLRNSGKAYTDWSGKNREERRIKSTCRGCRLKCSEKITQEQRCVIFKGFWDLNDINRQRDYISKYVECNKKSRTRIRKSDGQEEQSEYQSSKKSFTYVYHLPSDASKVRVCKTFFLNTLSISSQTVRTVFNKINSFGHVTEDRRGKTCKNSLLEESVKQSIRDHINMFETIDSHYCRQKTNRKYLPPTLNISKMFSLYEEHCLENNIERKATEGMYRHVFTTEFNLSFFIPKKDLCDACHDYENSSPEEKLATAEAHRQHIENKNLARELKLAAKERAKGNDAICAAVFDLQQILTTPKTEVGVAYYKLKLCTYNFTVFNLASKEAYCYMWHECIGKRGSSEIGSCLLLFIEHQISKGVKEFLLFSDNCPGQNRNKFLFSLYGYLSQKYDIKITHTFLERGHTQNEGDSVHSVIERAARSIPIYTPDQWYTVVRTAKRNNPYKVVEMSQDNIFDLKLLQQKTSLNWEKNDVNDKVCWNQIKIVQTNPEEPNILFYKDSYKYDMPFKRICLTVKGRRSIEVNIKELELQILYKELIPLTKTKYEHLMFLCKRKAILSQYHNFYRSLPFSKLTQEPRGSEDDH